MVRMSQDMIRKHQTFFYTRHLLVLVFASVIGLTVVLYFYLLNIEESNYNSVESAVRQRQETEVVLSEEQQLQRQRDHSKQSRHNTMMIPKNHMMSSARVLELDLPFLMYGTAWKKDNTATLVNQAIHSGFRFIDTACQPKHYNEKQVGDGWVSATAELGLLRSDIFLQTKFTAISGQDPNNIPYAIGDDVSIHDMITESLSVSLENLQTDYLDSWVMHSPLDTIEETIAAYHTMESFVDAEKVRHLGISNCYNVDWIRNIYDAARIKPKVIQNRFYGDSHWDTDIRKFCHDNGMWYQSFWTLTANRDALNTPQAKEWAANKGLPSPQTLLYAYLMSTGYGRPLDGTTSQAHMDEDISVLKRLQNGEKIFADDEELYRFEQLLGIHPP